ncbi:MAG: C-type lectin domain-containing protein [Planctomycetota bacterium]|jgi:hypothetical protein
MDTTRPPTVLVLLACGLAACAGMESDPTEVRPGADRAEVSDWEVEMGPGMGGDGGGVRNAAASRPDATAGFADAGWAPDGDSGAADGNVPSAEDAGAPADAAPFAADGAPAAEPDAEAEPDVSVEPALPDPDAAVEPDAEPSEPEPDAAVCAPEICNGLDDDCDGRIDNDGVCPCTLSRFEGHAYLVCATERTWQDADDWCARFGYRLAVIETAAEDDRLYERIAREDFDDTWIGLNDRAVEGDWRWLDGAPVDYTHWDDGEPNDGGDFGEDCGVIMTSENRASEWDDRACDSRRPYVCEAG